LHIRVSVKPLASDGDQSLFFGRLPRQIRF